MPPPTYGNCDPSGFLALELDTGTADTAWLDDTTLIEAIVGFDRVASWAAARQARLLAELARRRPRDPVPNQDRTSVGSTFAPDEVGVALHLSRGTAAARIGMAQRLLKVLPDTHAAWEAGRIDLLKARAIDDATVDAVRREGRRGRGPRAARRRRSRPWPSSRPRWRGR